MRSLLFVFSLIGITFSVATFTGCSGKAVDESNPSSLLSDAEDEIKSDHYQVALDKLRIVKNKFPYSAQAIEAQLRIADVYFLQESWPEAASSYETFKDLHPKHAKVPYAMLRAAKSYFNDIPSPISRDLTPAFKALESYDQFLRRFPSAPEADEARREMIETRKLLAEKELYIANFYYKRDFYESAKPRYEKILALYPESDAAKEAKEKLAKSIEQIKRDKAKDGGNRKR